MIIVSKSAVISECKKYRYELRRKISDHGRICCFIMLNPSTADAHQDDPTIRRCMGFAQRLECGELIVVNLFAYRATSPKDLFLATDPVGPDNFDYVTAAANEVWHHNTPERGYVICAWGAYGNHMDQGETVLGWLDRWCVPAYCLGTTKDGNPRHPLYLKTDAQLIKYYGKTGV